MLPFDPLFTPKYHSKSEFALLQTSSILSVLCNLANVGELSQVESGKDNFSVVFTYSIKFAYGIRKFHVALVQRRQRNVQKSAMHVQSCCFVNKNLLIFAVLLAVDVVVCFFVIQK